MRYTGFRENSIHILEGYKDLLIFGLRYSLAKELRHTYFDVSRKLHAEPVCFFIVFGDKKELLLRALLTYNF